MEERRKYVRINQSLSVSYQKMMDFSRASCRSVNISEGGIRLFLSRGIEPGIVLKLWIHFGPTTAPIELIGEVVWLKEKEDATTPFEIGIKFIEIDAEDRNRLSELVRSMSGEGDSARIKWMK